MTFFDDELAEGPAREPETPVEREVPSPAAPDEELSERGIPHRALSFVLGLLRSLVRYPRVTIEALLTVGATLAGVLILPPLAAAGPGPSPIAGFVLIRPTNVPAYLLYDVYGGGESVVVGMDTNVRVNWELVIIYNAQDSLINRSTHNASFGRALSAKFLKASPGEVGVLVRGTAYPGFHSFSEYKNGYFSVFSTRFNPYAKSGNNGLPQDDSTINFDLTGPVRIATQSGANEAITFPPIVTKTPSGFSGTPAAFNSEVFYNAGTYQNLTGGATIQGGVYWDWFDNGLFPGTVATGVDNATLQAEQNQTFIAAAMFGLAAAGAAGLALEVVDVLERRRDLRTALGSGET